MAKRPGPVDVPAFATAQRALLAAELRAEMALTADAVGGHTPAALQRAGLALTNLTVSGQRTGMGGRTVLTLEADAAVTGGGGGKEDRPTDKGGGGGGPSLPEHGLRTGDVVLVAEQPGGSAKKREMRELEQRGARGVVTRVRRAALEVALDGGADAKKGGGDDGDDEAVDVLQQAGRVWLVKLADEVTYRRMDRAMRLLQEMPEARYSPLIRVLFGLSSPGGASDAGEGDGGGIDWFDPSLNASQKEAVRFALAAPELALIHGPPGTGKTHTLVELIRQLVLRRGLRVLVCGPSNLAVDNLVERLAVNTTSSGVATTLPMVRLGHPARLLPSVLGHALDVLTQSSEAGAIVRDVRADMDAKQAELRRPLKKGGGSGGGSSAADRRSARRAIYADLRALRREYREREWRCTRGLVDGSRVVLATLHGAGGGQLRGGAGPGGKGAGDGGDAAADGGSGSAFDVVVIDEASQALEAQCWVPLLTARKVVLAGDHLQLPPTVKSKAGRDKATKKTTTTTTTTDADADAGPASQSPLEYTLFDRLLDLHGSTIKRMLTTQYRMHERIMRFPSDTLYEGKLVAAEAVRARLLRDLRYTGEDDGNNTGGPDGSTTGSKSKTGKTSKTGKASRASKTSKSKSAGEGGSAAAATAAVKDTDNTREPLIFIDTQGGDFAEDASGDGGAGGSGAAAVAAGPLGSSKANAREALVVRQHVRALVAGGGVRPQDIAVITPYNGQRALLAEALATRFPGIEVGSIDGFQGREKEAVVVSLVRSNDAGEVGFLAEKRRLNVAMTRPKRSLTVVGDSETVKRGSAFLRAWMEFLEENADLRYPDSEALAAEDAL